MLAQIVKVAGQPQVLDQVVAEADIARETGRQFAHRHQVFAGAAADYFFDTRVKGTLAALTLNAFPIDREVTGRKSSDQLRRLIDDGWSLVIFPEGGRSPDGWGQDFKGGAAYLSIRCGVPIVPVHLAGTGRILPKGKNRPKPGRTVVTFGKPLIPGEGERSQTLADRLERAVAALAVAGFGAAFLAAGLPLRRVRQVLPSRTVSR